MSAATPPDTMEIDALTVLLVESVDDEAALLSALADGGLLCDVVRVDTPADFEGVIEERRFDVIISNYALSSFHGLTALRIAKRKRPDTPFVFVSGVRGEEFAIEGLKAGADDYVLRQRISWLAQVVRKAVDRARERNASLTVAGSSQEAQEMDALLLEASVDGILIAGADGILKRVNRQLELMFGYSRDELIGKSLDILLPERYRAGHGQHVASYAHTPYVRKMSDRRGLLGRRRNGEEFPVAIALSPIPTKSGVLLSATIRDITAAKRAEEELAQRTQELISANDELVREQAERHKMEMELRLAQRLDSIGQLAAGIAHEINTPMQYIGDSVQFLQQSFEDLLRLLAVHEEVSRAAGTTEVRELAARVAECEEDIAVDYLRERVPRAIERTLDGVSHVASIVRAMKEFAHPASDEKSPADLNKALSNALMVAKNEYKYVAEVEMNFETLPMVPCLVGEMNQVFLNLIVNAGHAISDAVKDTGRKGLISVRTALEADAVTIRIQDTGTGIPEAIRNRIFDPFFTTKPVGKGTGQGLAIARAIVVGKHGGTLTFETELDQGTTFVIQLPLVEGHPCNEGKGQ